MVFHQVWSRLDKPPIFAPSLQQATTVGLKSGQTRHCFSFRTRFVTIAQARHASGVPRAADE